MRAALYARFSSDMQREASITDQFRNAERFAEREGWRVVARFDDKAISGSKKDRPGYQAMLAAAGRREFDVLLVDDLSRLSRDEIEFKQVESEDEEDDVSFLALMDEVERRHDWQAFRDRYIDVWDDHAKFRGYERKANAQVNRPQQAAQGDNDEH